MPVRNSKFRSKAVEAAFSHLKMPSRLMKYTKLLEVDTK